MLTKISKAIRNHIFIIIQLLACSCALAQKTYTPEFSDPLLDKYRWRHYEELSGRGFTCFCEGENGVMWFGIREGVMSYDGYTWTEYLMPDEIENFGNIRSMVFVGDTLFAGDNGIIPFVNGKWGKIKYQLTDEQLFDDMFVEGRFTFHQATVFDNTIVAATTYGIFIRKNGQNHYYTNEIVKQRFDTIATDMKFHVIDNFGDGVSFFFTNVLNLGNGFFYAFFSGTTDMKKHFKFRVTSNNDNPLEFIPENRKTDIESGGPIGSILRSNGEVWVVSEAYNVGVNILKHNEWKLFSFRENLNDTESSWHIVTLDDGSILITSFGVIYRYYNKQWSKITSIDIPFKALHVDAIYTKSGDLWLGDEQGEVYKIDYSPKHFTTYKNLNYQFTNIDGSLWFISDDEKVVYKKDNKWRYFDASDGLPENPQTLYGTKNGTVWCGGSHKGVSATAYLYKNKWIKQIHDSLSWSINYKSVIEANDGSVWFGGASNPKEAEGQQGGIVNIKIDGENYHSTYFYGERPFFVSIAILNDSVLYAGTETGLVSFKKGELRTINTDGEIKYRRVIKTNTGSFWTATNGTGVIKYKGDKKTVFTKNEGLTSNVIFDVYPTNDTSVWAATKEGYSYYNGHYWNNDIYPKEFVIAGESGKLSGHNENIWISKFPLKWTRRVYEQNQNKQGIHYFFSVKYKRDTMPPETHILFYHPEVDESGNTNIEWEGTDYMHHTRRKKLLYFYRLNDNEWSAPTEETKINLLNLKSGNYTFEVKAIDKDMNIDPTPAKVSFFVAKPVWKRAWFLLMLLFFGATVVYLITRIFIRNKKLAEMNNSLSEANNEINERQEEILQQSAQLEKANELLEKRHQEILTHKEEIHQFKIRYFINISHEFRTPLSLIVAPVEELTKAENLNKEQKYLFKIIRSNVRKLMKLVGLLMDFRKIETNKLKLKVSKGNLIELINSVVYDFKLQAKVKNIDLSVHSNLAIETELWFDTSILERVLFNLLSNAFKFTPDGGEIKISVYQKKEKINIFVSDTGKGISEDKIDLVFDRFYTDSTGSNQLNVGTGIGLAMCKRMMEIHKGSISVESEVNKGTTFNIEFPGTKADYNNDEITQEYCSTKVSELVTDDDTIEDTTEIIDKKHSTATSESLLMLIVEDNDELRQYLAKHFENYTVKTAHNGAEAFEIAKEILPDIIISDLMMPEMNGIDFCKKIKTTYLTNHIPIILLTAKANIEHQIEGIETGADAYISKPFSVKHLDANVKNLIRQRKLLSEKFSTHSNIKNVDTDINTKDAEFINKIEEIMSENFTDPDFSIGQLAKAVCFSRSQLDRKYKAITNRTPSEILRIKRLNYSTGLIAQKIYTISQVAYESGFSNPANFNTTFKKHFGKTPKEYENDM